MSTDPSDDERLRLERGLRFTHDATTVTLQTAERALDDVHALIEVLIGQGVISLKGYEKRRKLIEADKKASDGNYRVHLAVYEDKYAVQAVSIDCDARIPLCKARCCAMVFNLTSQDLDEGVVRWDYSHPYRIRRDADGYCAHNDRTTRGCTIHDKRPSVCRSYDCRHDARIWKDFEARIPADGL